MADKRKNDPVKLTYQGEVRELLIVKVWFGQRTFHTPHDWWLRALDPQTLRAIDLRLSKVSFL